MSSQHPEFPFVLNGRWEVVDRLGQGGMGTVYMARDLNLSTLTQQKKQCVVKELRDDFIRGEDKEKAQEFFMREVHVLADLDHPNIVRVLDQFSTPDERYYLVMEYVQGQNLHEMLTWRKQPFDEETVIEWVVQICDVLTYLHTHDPPVIYRDLKPSNIMINTKDQVKLVDFGIARPFEEKEDNTHVVSQGYSPPEQYWGAADPRSDIYALGATMHFLLTGQDPLALTVSSPKSVNPDVSNHIDNVVQICTQQEASLRFESAAAMKEVLLYRPVEEKPRSNNTLYAVLASVACIGLFLGGLIVLGKLQDQQETAVKRPLALEEERKLEAEKKALLKEAEELKQFRKMLHEQFQQNISSGSQPSVDNGSDDGENADAGIPALEETDEKALTDPEALK